MDKMEAHKKVMDIILEQIKDNIEKSTYPIWKIKKNDYYCSVQGSKEEQELMEKVFDDEISEIRKIIGKTGNNLWGTEAFNNGYAQAKSDILKKLNE